MLDNDTAAVRAMVGGPDFQEAPFNLATNGQRQPGSSFKPFTLVTALEQGHSTAEVYASAPQEIPFGARFENEKGKEETVNELFEVNNYEDSYLGWASLATATTYSDNSVYAQLGTEVGPDNVAATAEKLGVETDLSTDTEYSIAGRDFEPYNPALILGGLEVGVTPLEMAYAYNTLAAGGKRALGHHGRAARGGPVGDLRGPRRRGLRRGRPGRGPDRRHRRERGRRQAGDRPRRRRDRHRRPLDRGQLAAPARTPPRASPPGARPAPPTTTATPGSVGATEEITACVWVGHADAVDADGDRVRAARRSTAAPSRR